MAVQPPRSCWSALQGACTYNNQTLLPRHCYASARCQHTHIRVRVWGLHRGMCAANTLAVPACCREVPAAVLVQRCAPPHNHVEEWVTAALWGPDGYGLHRLGGWCCAHGPRCCHASGTLWQLAQCVCAPFVFACCTAHSCGGTVALQVTVCLTVVLAAVSLPHCLPYNITQVNHNSRAVKLEIVAQNATGGDITVRMPPNAYVIQRGWAMLFLMNGDVPSTRATWICLGCS